MTDPNTLADQVEALAGQLTKAERGLLVYFSSLDKPRRLYTRRSMMTGYDLEELGLAKRTFWQDKTYLTPLGKQIAAALRVQSKGTDA